MNILTGTYKTPEWEKRVELVHAHPNRPDSVLIRTLDGTRPWTTIGFGWWDTSAETYVRRELLTDVHYEPVPDYGDPAAEDAEAERRQTQEWLDERDFDEQNGHAPGFRGG